MAATITLGTTDLLALIERLAAFVNPGDPLLSDVAAEEAWALLRECEQVERAWREVDEAAQAGGLW